jgi:(2Fe-2S) ferredoxin
MAAFEKHIFVCTNRRPDGNPKGCCASKGAEAVAEALRVGVHSAGLRGRVRVNSAGCMDHCGVGPVVVVYPEGVWYAGVRVEDVPEILSGHILGGEPVERLRINRPGA